MKKPTTPVPKPKVVEKIVEKIVEVPTPVDDLTIKQYDRINQGLDYLTIPEMDKKQVRRLIKDLCNPSAQTSIGDIA